MCERSCSILCILLIVISHYYKQQYYNILYKYYVIQITAYMHYAYRNQCTVCMKKYHLHSHRPQGLKAILYYFNSVHKKHKNCRDSRTGSIRTDYGIFYNKIIKKQHRNKMVTAEIIVFHLDVTSLFKFYIKSYNNDFVKKNINTFNTTTVTVFF